MRVLSSASKLAWVGTQIASRNVATKLSMFGPSSLSRSSSPVMLSPRCFPASSFKTIRSASTTRLSSGMDDDDDVQLQNIGKDEMSEILDDYENGGDASGYVILDVREPHEVAATGQLSPNTKNLPLQVLVGKNVFAMEPEDFEDVCGFEKPTPDQTLVFSCAAGIRSVHAAQFAALNGYSQLVNYMGGANEWFQ